jgi:hypothetical protein
MGGKEAEPMQQITPKRVLRAMLQMIKLDIAGLKKATLQGQ